MVKIEVSQATRKKFLDGLDNFAKLTGQSVEDGIDKSAEIMGKNLIKSVQPYGTSAKIGQKLEKSIAKQVNRAIRHGNVAGQSGTASDVHKKNRNSEGQVPKDLATRGKFKRSPIEISERDALIKKKMQNAGIAKGAWYAATNQITGKKITGIAKWITRHENASNGTCNKTGKGIDRVIELTNSVPWIENVQTPDDVQKAIKSAYSNFISYINREMKKNIEKANA